MKGILKVKHCVRTALLYIFIMCSICARAQKIDFDELLEKTAYAVLLKELISLSDTIGLLHCRMPKDERRFVEDSILGKVVRVQHVFDQVDMQKLSEDEREYVYYWVKLAQAETLPGLLHRQVTRLEQVFYDACENNRIIGLES